MQNPLTSPIPCSVSKEGPTYRVYLACDDVFFCESLRSTFQNQADFEVCGEALNNPQVLKEIMKLSPNLVVMEVKLPPWDSFEIAEALKQILPEIPLFLVTEPDILQQVEKVALSNGIDTVFAKGEDVMSLVDNARAALVSSNESGLPATDHH